MVSGITVGMGESLGDLKGQIEELVAYVVIKN